MRNRTTAQPEGRRRKRCESHAQREARQLRGVVAHLQEQREADYRRIIDVLHDEILSRLVRVRLDLGEVRCRSRGTRAERNQTYTNATQILQSVIMAAARARAELRPPLLEHCGLEAAMGSCAGAWEKRHGLRCQFTRSGSRVQLQHSLVLELFRLFEEGLRSLAESCGPAQVEVEFAMRRTSCRLCLHVSDLSPDAFKRLIASPALLAARERARRIAGKLVVCRAPAPGITLVIIIPNSGAAA